MKKLVLIAAVLAITSLGAFAQGNVSIGGGPAGVWNNTTNYGAGASVASSRWNNSGFDVSLLFSTSGSSALHTLASSTATNGTTSYTIAGAWSALSTDLSGSWFYVNGSNSTPSVVAVGGLTGSFSYNASTSWSANNVSSSQTYSAYEIAWYSGVGGIWNTPALAAANGAWVGWSQVFSYSPTSGATQPTQITPLGLAGYFGVGGSAAPVPEPASIALAGLGGLSLLMFRRKKA